MALAAGTRLGPYEILATLGAGGMGEVYRGRDTRLDRAVAIKILPSHLSSNPARRQRFEREAKTISSLNHAHICTLHDIGHQDGIDFLVMEYLEGETLAGRGPLYRVSAAGGEPKPATELDTSRQETGHAFPEFLPDGRHFLYYVVSSEEEARGVCVGSLDSREKKAALGGKLKGGIQPPGLPAFPVRQYAHGSATRLEAPAACR